MQVVYDSKDVLQYIHAVWHARVGANPALPLLSINVSFLAALCAIGTAMGVDAETVIMATDDEFVLLLNGQLKPRR